MRLDNRERRARRRKLRKALLLDRALRQELALEGARDLLLGRALRRLREGRRYLRLGFARWSDYVAERLGCELRWAQYLVRLDVELERFPELRTAVESGLLSPLKVIHLSRLLTPDMSEARRHATITTAALLSVRELEARVRQALAEDRARTTLAHCEADALSSSAIPNPWDLGPGRWLNFPASARALTLFEAGVEVARRLSGDDLPRHACLEYMVADHFSTIGWPSHMDRDRAEDDQVRRRLRLRAEDRARAELESVTEEEATCGSEPRGSEPEGSDRCGSAPRPLPDAQCVEQLLGRRRAARLRRNHFYRDQRLRRQLLTPDLDPDATNDPHDLDRIVKALEALDRDLRSILGELLSALQSMDGHQALGWTTWREYCQEGLGLDPRRAARLMRFRAGLDRLPALATAYHAGRLSYLQVLALMSVVVPETAEAWGQWAAGASVRRTREVVDQAWILSALSSYSPNEPRSTEPTPGETGGTTFAHSEGVSPELPRGAPLPPPSGGRQPTLAGVVAGPSIPPWVPRLHFRIFLPGDLADFVVAGLRSCVDDRGLPLPEDEALAAMATAFLENLVDPEIQRLITQFAVLERDGWKCAVPTCTSRVSLHEHHIEYLSHGGPDVDWNQVSLCFVHHILLLHGSLKSIAVSGIAPDALEWRLGIRSDAPPLLVFRGDRRVALPATVAPGKSVGDPVAA